MSDQLALIAGMQRRDLSQWFTPRETASRIAEWALRGFEAPVYVLEPSAGHGALALALRNCDALVTCVEADPENCVRLNAHHFDVLERDFLELEPTDFGIRFDLAVMNPPFENGQTEQHIMHALKFADRVVCHCPLTTLAGVKRREKLWSEVRLLRLAICSSRPNYGPNGGMTDMCTIDVMPGGARMDIGYSTEIDWWP